MGRGKNIGWTIEQDLKLLQGGRVQGRPAQANANRRYQLRNSALRLAASSAATLLKNLRLLESMGKAPKSCTAGLMRAIKRLVGEIG